MSTDLYDFPGRENYQVSETIYLSASRLKSWTKEVFMKLTLSEEHATIMSEVLVESDLLGVDTHGTYKIALWVKRLLEKGTNAHAQFQIVHETPTTAVVDAQAGFGQVAGFKAMDLAIRKSDQIGSGFVAVRNSTSLTAARYYALKAANAGKIGIVLTNADPVAAPFGGRTPLFGTNPWCIAVPGDEYPIIMDTATTVANWTKLVVYANEEKEIPGGWALDENGNSTVDPKEAMKGSVLHVGAHKGYMFGLFAEIFSGVLGGGLFLNQVLSYGRFDQPTNTSHFIGAMNVDALCLFRNLKTG
ncbi:probable malate/L-lactate dehydrogenase [Halalkalibacter wakoensis JCM 9140]|uniref:Probable malate/L-lactate dehydrogenase n=1 Tax=Halalkalibacter wakoensis JCM 9140 TaxID=1236970 RepID=W4Q9C6_9BACI|nr:Ldh family oxidoreductase [Halalkalibacter wakoensis]GAE28278.1 probable malate/L-lactate dehydrogenase [Halalkalibacter wakoensis JCM 9140]